jgi:hypothetical protein
MFLFGAIGNYSGQRGYAVVIGEACFRLFPLLKAIFSAFS